MNTDEIIKVCDDIVKDIKKDINELDGQPFDGKRNSNRIRKYKCNGQRPHTYGKRNSNSSQKQLINQIKMDKVIQVIRLPYNSTRPLPIKGSVLINETTGDIRIASDSVERHSEWRPYHIYFIDDDVQHQDWVIITTNFGKGVGQFFGGGPDKSMRRIIATTDPQCLLNTACISDDFIKAYIEEKGQIDKTILKYTPTIRGKNVHIRGVYERRANNCVIPYSVEDRKFTRTELDKIAFLAYEEAVRRMGVVKARVLKGEWWNVDLNKWINEVDMEWLDKTNLDNLAKPDKNENQ